MPWGSRPSRSARSACASRDLLLPFPRRGGLIYWLFLNFTRLLFLFPFTFVAFLLLAVAAFSFGFGTLLLVTLATPLAFLGAFFFLAALTFPFTTLLACAEITR